MPNSRARRPEPPPPNCPALQPAQEVVLQVAGKVFRTVTDKNSAFRFRAPGIPSGPATLTVGGQAKATTI